MRVEILDQFLFSGRLVTGEDNYEEAEHRCDKTKKQAQKNDYRLFEGELTPVYTAPPMSLTKQGRTVRHRGYYLKESHESANKI